jgi:hypothetical protein
MNEEIFKLIIFKISLMLFLRSQTIINKYQHIKLRFK